MDLKEAVRNAIVFAVGTLGQERTGDIRLEEIESSTVEGRPVWLITLSSAMTTVGSFASVREALGTPPDREYKIFTVTKDTGEILSMKIRLLTAPGT